MSSSTDDRLERAGQEILDLKLKAEAVVACLARFDSADVLPETAWRSALNRIWNELMDVGDITGARIVSRILSTLPPESGF